MRINVSQQLKEPIGATRRYRIESERPPARGEITLLRTDRGIFASGRLKTSASVSCSRCLEPFDLPLTLVIEEEFVVSPSASRDEEEFVIDESKEIDLGEPVRQSLLLALPMKPLCREGCLGLCPRCGHNLNLGPCPCGRGDGEGAVIATGGAHGRGGGEER
ncbi:MAG: DUF177 domain-containing protein [Chloroflexota bacterium]|nr:DUF177 domain-containing protein [Chloroflexota bacterium]